MFTSKKQLIDSMGVNPEIAAFFVDRKVPVDNLYWKGRLLYVSRGTGYLFIPLYFDLMFKSGLPLSAVLDDSFVQLAENILHSAAQWEHRLIDREEHIVNCRRLLDGRIHHPDLYDSLNAYFTQPTLRPHENLGTASPALNRGDSLLYQLCSLPEHANWKLMVSHWYSLVPSFLLMDDVMDLHADTEAKEENAIADFGAGKQGLMQAFAFLKKNFENIEQFNPVLASYFQHAFNSKMTSPYIIELLKSEEHGA
jgi:hypothetical protein